MHRHYELRVQWGMDTYVADPHTPWQHRNQRAPQRSESTLPNPHTNFRTITDKGELQEIITEINNQPRKHLNQITPTETHQHHSAAPQT